jgi:hypothetical protein
MTTANWENEVQVSAGGVWGEAIRLCCRAFIIYSFFKVSALVLKAVHLTNAQSSAGAV